MSPSHPGLVLSQDDQDDSSWFWAYHPDVWSQIRMMPVFGESIYFLLPLFLFSILGSSCFILRRTCQSSCLHPDRRRRIRCVFGFISLPSRGLAGQGLAGRLAFSCKASHALAAVQGLVYGPHIRVGPCTCTYTWHLGACVPGFRQPPPSSHS